MLRDQRSRWIWITVHVLYPAAFGNDGGGGGVVLAV